MHILTYQTFLNELRFLSLQLKLMRFYRTRSFKITKYEKKFTTLEKKAPDALEMAAEAHAKREA